MRSLLPSIYFAASVLCAWLGRKSGLSPTAADLIVLVAALIATIHLLSRQLPVQNIVGLAITITVFSCIILVTTKLLENPFRPVINRQFVRLPDWTSPLLWIVALINARSGAKRILQRAPKNNCGYWILGLSSFLVALLSQNAGINFRIFGIQFALALIAFIATTPWFLDKRNAPITWSYQPLFILILLFVW